MGTAFIRLKRTWIGVKTLTYLNFLERRSGVRSEKQHFFAGMTTRSETRAYFNANYFV